MKHDTTDPSTPRTSHPATPAQSLSRPLGVVLADDGIASVTNAIRWANHVAESRRLPVTVMEFLPATSVPSLIRLSSSAHLLVVSTAHPLRRNRTHRSHGLSTLLTYAASSVAVIPEAHHHRPHAPILVGIQGSSTDERYAIEAAFDAASRCGAPLIAVHCWNEPGALGLPSVNWSPIEWANNREQEREVVAERLAGFQEQYPDVEVRRVIRSDRAGGALIPLARSAQLVVVSGGGQPTRRMLLHNTSLPALLTNSDVPVLVARHPGISPSSQ